MEILWFCIVAVMVAAYVVFDGFDIGAGIVHLFVARSDKEKRTVLRSIGPVWDGNEVWLLAAGGVLYFAFPALYASSFSGFYLPLMMVLWLLILRGASIEFRNHIDGPIWSPLWDVIFGGASALLAIFFGAALGNVVRGVPLGEDGYFFLPLWTHFGTSGDVGILDWYTVAIGVAAFSTLALHGALWVTMKTDGPFQVRTQAFASVMWYVVATFTVLITMLSFQVQPVLAKNFVNAPLGAIFPILAVAGLAGIKLFKDDVRPFLASCVYIVGMLTSAAYGVFPYVLPSNQDPARGLTIYNAATSQNGLQIGLIWWTPAMILVIAYFVFTYRKFAGKVELEEGGY